MTRILDFCSLGFGFGSLLHQFLTKMVGAVQWWRRRPRVGASGDVRWLDVATEMIFPLKMQV